MAAVKQAGDHHDHYSVKTEGLACVVWHKDGHTMGAIYYTARQGLRLLAWQNGKWHCQPPLALLTGNALMSPGKPRLAVVSYRGDSNHWMA